MHLLMPAPCPLNRELACGSVVSGLVVAFIGFLDHRKPGCIHGAADDVYVSVLPKSGSAFLRCAYSDRAGQIPEVIPLSDFCRPGITGNTQRRNHQYTAYVEAIEEQISNCGQGDAGFA